MASVATSGCLSNCTRSGFLEHEWTAEELWAPWEVLADYFEYQPWLFSLLGSAMVGLSGVFPLLVIPIDEAADLKHGESAKTLKILLSFAVGGLLGDVFLHLLPEAWANHAAAEINKNSSVNHASMACGLWVLCGFLVFVIAEKMFSVDSGDDEDEEELSLIDAPKKISIPHENNNCNEFDEFSKLDKNGHTNGATSKVNGIKLNGEITKSNGMKKNLQQNSLKKQSNGVNGVKYYNGYTNRFTKSNGIKHVSNGYHSSNSTHDQQFCEKTLVSEKTKDRPRRISGYLNLMANCVDNFTHGLAVGGSFLVSFRLGALTTFAILIHEIPHEIGDFAILLKSGFNRWDAAKAQLMTAAGGMCGAFVAVVSSGDAVESKTSWILPFTAGGFLHIGLVTVLPELLKETDPWESLKQMGALLTGIVVMAFLTIICD